MQSDNFKKQTGFSLLELAIALAVLAVLSGGVLKGRELLKSASVQATIADMASLETAISAFQARYAALPGDFAAAAAAGLGGKGGDGDGSIGSNIEIGQVFSHLQRAGFVQGSFTGMELTSSTSCPPSACMASPLGGTYLISNVLTGPSTPDGVLSILLGNNIAATQLAEMDRKMDDGNPTTGAIQVLGSFEKECVTGAAWDETNNNLCNAIYTLR